ncbi:MAG: LysM peptidoglycan-binding domain-containing protein [Coprobacillaceae bacterium]
MQKIYLEKAIDLQHQLKELIALSVDESINYKIENEGIRAVGNLIVKGEYRNIDKQTFEETLELDILATFDKILDQRDFSIKVEDFDYAIRDGNIHVTIEAGVHGVVTGENRYINDNPVDDIESLIREEDMLQVDPLLVAPEPVREETKVVEEVKEVQEEREDLTVEETVEVVAPVEKVEKIVETKKVRDEDLEIEKVAQDIDEQLQETVYQSKSRPIFQDTTDSVGTYYLYIVQDDDTYESIAERYENDEFAIKEYNQNRELEVGSVLIIPYAP